MKWVETTLESVSLGKPQYGANASSVDSSGKKPRFVRITDIDDNGVLRPDCRRESDLENIGSYRLEDGDFLFARTGSVGRTYLYRKSDGDCIFAGYLIRFRLKRELIDPQYLFYFTKSPIYRLWVATKQRVAIQANINGGEYASLRFPLPTLQEQHRMVELLEKANGLRRQRAEADQRAIRILPAHFHNMFGDPGTNPKGWPQHDLKEVIAEAAYGTSISSNTSGDGLPVLRMNNITADGRIDTTKLKHILLTDREAERQMLRTGDLLFNRTNTKELVGKTGLWRGEFPAVAASYLIRIRVDTAKVLPDYVWAWMNTAYFKQLLFDISRRAVGMANINATELRSMPILVPDLQRQKCFSERLMTLEKLASQQEQSANHLENLFAVMLHRAFTGELTAKWREAHLKELLVEMEHQAKVLNGSNGGNHG